MDYARGLLEKYGWTEGKGLGKNETGISEPLKPSLKFDTTGIGHDHSDQFTFKWWEIAFNNAANRIEVQKSDSDGAMIRTDETKQLHLSTKKPWTAKLKSENSLEYGSFVKTEKLTSEGELIPLKSTEDPVSFVDPTPSLTDEELFRICGGRTAHKAARHGHKLVGKLARVIEQEKKLLSQHEEAIPALENTDENSISRKKKKKKRKSENCDESVENAIVNNEVIEVEEEVENADGNVDSTKVKKRKKKRKVEKSCEVEPELQSECNLVESSVDDGVMLGENSDEIEEDSMKVKKRKKKRKVENSCEVQPGQQSECYLVESSVVEVKKKKKKRKSREENCTLYEEPNGCKENPSIVYAKENTKDSKKKKKKESLTT